MRRTIQSSFALLFPGQGSQFVGMGAALAEKFPQAKGLFERADAALGRPVCLEIMRNGPEDVLQQTENTQPALLAYSYAVMKMVEMEQGISVNHEDCACVMGHSLGEFTAMLAAQVLELEDAVKIVQARGRAMQAAADAYGQKAGHGFAMMALLPMSEENALKACELAKAEFDGGICQIANINGPNQIVLSGARPIVERACEIAKKEFKARRAVPLKVSAPFHCDIMKDAEASLSKVLEEATWSDPVVPIISNVTAQPIFDSRTLKSMALEQLTAPVQWERSVRTAVETYSLKTMYELGGDVLTGLNKKIVPDVDSQSIKE